MEANNRNPKQLGWRLNTTEVWSKTQEDYSSATQYQETKHTTVPWSDWTFAWDHRKKLHTKHLSHPLSMQGKIPSPRQAYWQVGASTMSWSEGPLGWLWWTPSWSPKTGSFHMLLWIQDVAGLRAAPCGQHNPLTCLPGLQIQGTVKGTAVSFRWFCWRISWQYSPG